MNKLIFLDCETTGLNDEDRLVEVGYKPEGRAGFSGRFKAPVPVKIGAMAVNHITNKMLEDKPVFKDSGLYRDIERFALDDWILVAHNAPFDLAMLAKEGIHFKRYIDTKKLSHALDPDEMMESHRLQYLRYYYNVELPQAEAHTAEGDITVLEAVYHKLVEELLNPPVDKLLAISTTPVLHSKFKFGKYNGNLIADIARVDPGYIQWLLDTKKTNQKNGQDETDWIYTLEHYQNN